MNVAVATRMTVDEVGLALALYGGLHRADPAIARRYLDPTPRDCFDESVRWVGSNEKTVRLVADDPVAIAERAYSLNPARGFFSRLLGLGRSKGTTAPDNDELASVMQEIVANNKGSKTKKRADHDSLRALVEQSLKET